MRKALLGIIFVAGVSLALGEEPEYFPRNDFNDCKNYYGGIRDSDIKNLNLRKQRMGVKMPRAYYNNEKKKIFEDYDLGIWECVGRFGDENLASL